ncbi:DUF3817 domain-containing protein [Tardiphaga sp. OK246]|uniref:DUF3817 domain-containing protein n=1 Tax=Tardiphaga sp. OK246 TaxID=1855307 RepID=UPI000B76C816|nr:DUF3817 domain-containing protein [Tardiphaga sp. OK246]
MDAAALRRVKLASATEASTLVLLVCIAMPIKYIAGLPEAVRIAGPIHGLAFLYYAWCLLTTFSAGLWSRRQAALLALAAFLPFAGFFSCRFLKRRMSRIGSGER